MHQVALGERKRFSDEAPQPLAQDVVEPFNTTRLAVAFARGFMLFTGQHLLVSVPKIAVHQASLVPLWDALPKQTTRLLAATADCISDDLAGAPALGQPNPTLVLAASNERPHFVEFKHVRAFGFR